MIHTIRKEQREHGLCPVVTFPPVPITDTSPSARTLQLQVQRAMSGEQRLLMALEMSVFARELAKQGIRDQHPGWSSTEVARELIRRTFLPGLAPARLR